MLSQYCADPPGLPPGRREKTETFLSYFFSSVWLDKVYLWAAIQGFLHIQQELLEI